MFGHPLRALTLSALSLGLTATGATHAPVRAATTSVIARPAAAALLSAAREAMGGEASLTAISTLTIVGSVVQTAKAGTVMNIEGVPVESAVGGRLNLSLDIKVALPDRYVRRTGYTPPLRGSGAEVVEYRGFNGSELIRDTSSQYGGQNDSKHAASPKLPETRVQYLLDAKHAFAALLLPLLAASYDGYPFNFGVGESEVLASGPATAVTVAGADGLRWKLFLDDATHLPVMLTGQLKPMVSGLFVEYGIPAEDWRMTIADYRVSNGLKWPRKLTSAIGDKVLEEIHYERFTINPKISEKVFAPNDGR
jgi:hypothetical protein